MHVNFASLSFVDILGKSGQVTMPVDFLCVHTYTTFIVQANPEYLASI